MTLIKRKAHVGETIVITDCDDPRYRNGDTFTVTEKHSEDNGVYAGGALILHEEYHVTVPDSAATHVINGQTYVEVDRKAGFYDKVVITGVEMGHGFEVGSIKEITEFDRGYAIADGMYLEDDEDVDYRVLEPVAATHPQPSRQVTEAVSYITEFKDDIEAVEYFNHDDVSHSVSISFRKGRD